MAHKGCVLTRSSARNESGYLVVFLAIPSCSYCAYRSWGADYGKRFLPLHSEVGLVCRRHYKEWVILEIYKAVLMVLMRVYSGRYSTCLARVEQTLYYYVASVPWIDRASIFLALSDFVQITSHLQVLVRFLRIV